MRQCVRWQRAAKCWLSESKVYGCKRETNHGSSNPVNDTIKNTWVYIYEYLHLYTFINNYQNVSHNMSCVHALKRPPLSAQKVASTWRLPKKAPLQSGAHPGMTRCFIPWMNMPFKKQHIFWCCLLKSHILYMPRLERYVYYMRIYIYIIYIYTSYL